MLKASLNLQLQQSKLQSKEYSKHRKMLKQAIFTSVKKCVAQIASSTSPKYCKASTFQDEFYTFQLGAFHSTWVDLLEERSALGLPMTSSDAP